MAYNPNTNSFDLLADLALQKGTPSTVVYVSGQTTVNDGGGGNYMWDNSSTATSDGSKVIAVNGVTTGRWLRSKSTNYGTGQVSFPGITLTTRYTRAHGQNFTPAQIHIQARSAGAASSLCWIENITSTNFDIVFANIPLLTGNIVFDFLAIRSN